MNVSFVLIKLQRGEVNHIMVSTMCVYACAFRLQLVQRSEEVRLTVDYG